jgi:2-phospho-L-lactate/phosphoenolpyruvate guanylyltransferase
VTVRAIIPLKALAAAKGRLAGALDAAARQELVAWMATHVIQVCLACDAVDEVLVVAGDETAAQVARSAGADVMVVAQPGLSRALGAADAVSAGCASTIVVAADLPDLSVDDLLAVVAAAGEIDGPVVVVAPTDDGGTGALLRRPPDVIATSYGARSAARHITTAVARGVEAISLSRAGLAHDVDTPEHLSPALARRRGQVVGSAFPTRHTEESACRKAP